MGKAFCEEVELEPLTSFPPLAFRHLEVTSLPDKCICVGKVGYIQLDCKFDVDSDKDILIGIQSMGNLGNLITEDYEYYLIRHI